MRTKAAVPAVFLLALFVCLPALGGIRMHEPGSVLVYPYVTWKPGVATLVSVTNVNTCHQIGPGGSMTGEVWVEFYYVEGEYGFLTTRVEHLNPGETLNVAVNEHNPTITEKGWLYVVGLHPDTHKPMKYDGIVEPYASNKKGSGLIGRTLIADGLKNYIIAIPAIGIQDLNSLSFQSPLDINGNGKLDIGKELEAFPSSLYISEFIEQGFLNAAATLVLLTFYDGDIEVMLNFGIFNNEGLEYSRNYQFSVWMAEPLNHISNAFSSLQGDPSRAPTGWAEISVLEAVNPYSGAVIHKNEVPLLGIIVQSLIDPNFSNAEVLHGSPISSATGPIEYNYR